MFLGGRKIKKQPKKTDCTVLREGIDYYIIETTSKKEKQDGHTCKRYG
jgi:uncharacterized protein YheU (UPF0270 family)